MALILLVGVGSGAEAQKPLQAPNFVHKSSPAGAYGEELKYSDALPDGSYFSLGVFSGEITLAGESYTGIDNPNAFLVKHAADGSEVWAMACKGDSQVQEWVVLPDGRVVLFIEYRGKLALNGKEYPQSAFLDMDGKVGANMLILGLKADGTEWFSKLVKSTANDYGMVVSSFLLETSSAALNADATKIAFAVNATCLFKIDLMPYVAPDYMVFGGFGNYFAPSSFLFELDLADKTISPVATFKPTKDVLVEDEPLAASAAYTTGLLYGDDGSLYIASSLSGSVDVTMGATPMETLDLGLNGSSVVNLDLVLTKLKADRSGKEWSQSLRVEKVHGRASASVSRMAFSPDGAHLLLVGGYQGNLMAGGHVLLEAVVAEEPYKYTDYFYALLDAATGNGVGIESFGMKLSPSNELTLPDLPKVQMQTAGEALRLGLVFDGDFSLGGEHAGRSEEKGSKKYNAILIDGTFKSGGSLPTFTAAYPFLTKANSAIQSISFRTATELVVSGRFAAKEAAPMEFFGKEYTPTNLEVNDVFAASFTLQGGAAPVNLAIAPAEQGEVAVRVNRGAPVVFKGKPTEDPELEVSEGFVLEITGIPVVGGLLKELSVNGNPLEKGKFFTVPAGATEVSIKATFVEPTIPLAVTIDPSERGALSLEFAGHRPVVFEGNPTAYPEIKVAEGTTFRVVATPVEVGAALKTLTVNDGPLASGERYVVPTGATNVSVKATFAEPTIPVEVTVAPDASLGSISMQFESGGPVEFSDPDAYPTLKVAEGAKFTITATPSAGRSRFEKLMVNGATLTNGDEYTVPAGVEKVEIKASFERIVPVHVAIEPANLGKLSVQVAKADPVVFEGDPTAFPALEVKVADVLTIVPTPAEGASLKGVTVNGNQLTGEEYTVPEGVTEVKIVAMFEETVAPTLLPVKVTLNGTNLGKVVVKVGENDPVTFDGEQATFPELNVKPGDVLTITATPIADATLTSLTVAGEKFTSGETYSIPADATGEVEIVATFVKNETAVESALLSTARVLNNPFGGVLTVVGIGAEPATYALYNVQGSLILQGVSGGSEVLTIPTESVRSGVYILRLVDAEGLSRTFRVVAR